MSMWTYDRRCVICNTLFKAKRTDAFLCSATCRKRHNRRTAKHEQYAERQASIDVAKQAGREFLASIEAMPATSAGEFDQVEAGAGELDQVEAGAGELDHPTEMMVPPVDSEGLRLVFNLCCVWPKLPRWVRDMLRRFGRKYGESTGE